MTVTAVGSWRQVLRSPDTVAGPRSTLRHGRTGAGFQTPSRSALDHVPDLAMLAVAAGLAQVVWPVCAPGPLIPAQ